MQRCTGDGGQAPNPNLPGHPSCTPAFPSQGSVGPGANRQASRHQGRARRQLRPHSASAPGCASAREGIAGEVTDATYVGAKGVAPGEPRDCSRFMLEERRTEPGLRTAAAVKDKEMPFHVQGCRRHGFPGIALTLRGVEGGRAFGAQAVGGGGSSPARALPVSCCDSKGAFGSPTKGYWHFLMCDRKGSLHRG